MATPPGKLGEYEIEREIARGGMGVVWLAKAPDGTRVAIKTMLAGMADSDDMVRRFLREAQAAARLDHPNIVPIVGDGNDGGTHYFAMRFVEGKGLDDVIDEGPVPIRRAVEITRATADALAHAHDAGIIHRDVKPSNIIIDGSGAPHLTDFGLARSVEVSTALTKSGSCIGTPDYMPPEQAQGRLRQIDGRSDCYSLGVALYEMLTCKTPFEADNPSGTIYKVLTEEPKSPRLFNAQVDGKLEAICMKLIEKDPDRRYPDAHALVRDLDAWLTGGRVSARRPSSMARLARQAGSHTGKRLLLAIAATAAIAATGIWLWVRGADTRMYTQQTAQRTVAARRVQPLLGSADLESPDPAQRLGDLNHALALVPNWPPWLIERAIAQLELGLLDGALSDCAAARADHAASVALRHRATMVQRLALGLASDQAAAAAAIGSPATPGGPYDALQRALAAAFGNDHAGAVTALADAGDARALDGALPWERALVEAVCHERAGAPADALGQYVRAIRARSRAPSFALGLLGMARSCEALAAGGAATVPSGDDSPGAPGVLTEPDPWKRAFAALVEATRRAPALVPPRRRLRALCELVATTPNPTSLDPTVARLTLAQLSLCEGRLDEAGVILQGLEQSAAVGPARVATALRGLVAWTLRDDPEAATQLLQPLAKLPAFAGRPAEEREPVEIARRVLALIARPDEAWPARLSFLTPFGRWAASWLAPRTLDAAAAAVELEHHLHGSAGQPGARPWPYSAVWAPALAHRVRLQHEAAAAYVAARPDRRADAREMSDLAGAPLERLREAALRESPALTAEAAATLDEPALRDRIASARYTRAIAALRDETARTVAVGLAVWPGCPLLTRAQPPAAGR